jgi:hypothetical protein
MRLRPQLRISRPAPAHRVLPGILLLLILLAAPADLRAQGQSPASPAGFIHGLVKSGNMPLPGVTVTAINTLTGQKALTWTTVDGTYALQVPANGRYVVRAQMAGFAPLTHEVVIAPATNNVQADLEMVLLSRAQQAAPANLQAQIAGAMSEAGAGGNARNRSGGNASGNDRGFQCRARAPSRSRMARIKQRPQACP